MRCSGDGAATGSGDGAAADGGDGALAGSAASESDPPLSCWICRAGVGSVAPVLDPLHRSRICRSPARAPPPLEEGARTCTTPLSEEGDGPRAPARRPASVAVAGVPRARLGPAGGRVLGRGGRASGLRGRERKILRDLEKRGGARDLGSVAGDGQSRKRVRWQACCNRTDQLYEIK